MFYDEETLEPTSQRKYWEASVSSDARKQEILLIEPSRHIMCAAAYKPQHQRIRVFSFYTYMPSFSDEHCATYRKIDGSEYVVAIRGVCSESDVGVALRHAAGLGISNTQRYTSALSLVTRVNTLAKYDNAALKLTGHSLGALIAAKINYELLGGHAQAVYFSPACQPLDSDVYTVYPQRKTFIVAKPDDVISTFAFAIANSNCFVSENEAIHSLGDVLYVSEDAVQADPELAAYTDTEWNDQLNQVVQMAKDAVMYTVGFKGQIGLRALLYGIKKLREDPTGGVSAALEFGTSMKDTPIPALELSFLIELLVHVLLFMVKTAFSLSDGGTLSTVITTITAEAVSNIGNELQGLIMRSLFDKGPPPLILCKPPSDAFFEKYDMIGGVKPLLNDIF